MYRFNHSSSSSRIAETHSARRHRWMEPLERRLLLASIVEENALPGSPPSEWDIDGDGDSSIQGFATDISVNHGQTISFKINDAQRAAYHMDIYRMGYYQGLGARRVATVSSSQTLRQVQPSPLTDSATGLIDCGNWAVSASWQVPADATSGIYFAKVIRDDTGGASHIYFIVRDDSSHSDVLFKTSDTTWQAYNSWGGEWIEAPSDRAYKASYNRPFNTRARDDGYGSWNFVFWAEYPMVRFMESNGYDVTYFTSVDADRYGSLIANHKVMLSVGHDEYWSGQERANVESARDAGVNLAFFSGNEIYRKIRWENSRDSSGTPYRTMVCYKETNANAKIDPMPNVWTGCWRDPRFSPPADGGRPENALSGTAFTVCVGPSDPGISIKVPAEEGKFRFWRNTSVANLSSGQTATVGTRVLGYEWDEDLDNGFRPAGLMHLSTTTSSVSERLLGDNINIGVDAFGAGSSTHNLTLYRAPSRALVFSAGTVQWAWGLDSQHDGSSTTTDRSMQQATVNLLADMGIQPGSLQSGLIRATASTDLTAPTTIITSPTAGASLTMGSPVTIKGTASDIGGLVSAVEVSTDGGLTWHPATGRTSWQFTWTPATGGTFTILCRAADDSGNLQSPGTSLVASVQGPTPPSGTSIWSSTVVPRVASDSDSSAVELGVKFRSDVAGTITGIRFFKGASNTGTHTGTLWTRTGTLLATGTFTNETASGWQVLKFVTPIAISANTTYIASYHTNTGHYAADTGYFAGAGIDNAPLHALQDGVDGANGVYAYGSGGFPTSSYQSTNYWVDVFFTTSAADTTPPMLTARLPAPGATAVSIAATVSAVFSEPVQSTTISFTLIDAGSRSVPCSFTYDPATLRATITPGSPLSYSTTYTARVSGAKDLAGNTMADVSWTFTTAPAPSSSPQTIWSDQQIPATLADPDSSAVELGVKFQTDLPGYITGIRFYKSSSNTGTHTGSLWTSSGTRLATATFTNETASGWQLVTFATPVAIDPNTTYVASYHTSVGHYSVDSRYFASTGADSGPLHALQDGVDGGNGVYTYGAGGFPSSTYQSCNYWVDVVFVSDTTPPPAEHQWRQSTTADFAAGTFDNVILTSTADGEVQLAPAFQDDFAGTSLSSTWTANTWTSGTGTAAATVANGILSLGRTQLLSTLTIASGTPVEGRIAFGATAWQQFGLATDLTTTTGNSSAVFTTKGTTGTLYARVNNAGTVRDVSLGSRPTGFHLYKVRPIAKGFEFYIDGVLKTTIARTIPASAQLHLALSAQKGAPAELLQADWVRVVSYPSGGEFISSIYDAGQTVVWQTASWSASLPSGTSLLIETSSGDTPTPDSSWSAWSPVSTNGQITSPATRYTRYRVTFITADSSLTPVLLDIAFA